MYACAPWVSSAREAREGFGSLGTRVTSGCESQGGCQEAKPRAFARAASAELSFCLSVSPAPMGQIFYDALPLTVVWINTPSPLFWDYGKPQKCSVIISTLFTGNMTCHWGQTTEYLCPSVQCWPTFSIELKPEYFSTENAGALLQVLSLYCDSPLCACQRSNSI